jgi:NADH dehydrogenase/NADH:ubiquinone oxidoreductase subunit G
MVEFVINGKTVKAEKGETILDVARREGFDIPTLCYHDTLGSDGRCRLCMVEVQRGNRKRIVTSCLYPVEDGIEVFTESSDVLLVRKAVLELLLARCPESEVVRYIAKEHGVNDTGYAKDNDKGKCILCNLCVKTCEFNVGVTALGMSGKGPQKKVTTPYGEPSHDCIGCGACVAICPTGHIYMEDRDGVRMIWNKRFELARCPKCNRYHAPVEQLEFIATKSGTPIEQLLICPDCK